MDNTRGRFVTKGEPGRSAELSCQPVNSALHSISGRNCPRQLAILPDAMNKPSPVQCSASRCFGAAAICAFTTSKLKNLYLSTSRQHSGTSG